MLLLPSVFRKSDACMCVCAHVFTCGCTCTCGDEKSATDVPWVLSSLVLLLFEQSLSLAWSALIGPAWLISKLQVSTCLCPPCHHLPALGLQACAHSPCFMCNLGDRARSSSELSLQLHSEASSTLTVVSEQSYLCGTLFLLRKAEFLPDFPDE